MSVAADDRELLDIEEEELSRRLCGDWLGLAAALRRKARLLTWTREEHEAAAGAAHEAEQVALALLDLDGVAWAQLWRAAALAGSGLVTEGEALLGEAAARFAVTHDAGGLYCASLCRERLQQVVDDPVGLWRERLRRAAYGGDASEYETVLVGAARVGRAALSAGELETAEGLFALVAAPGAPRALSAAATLERARIAGLRGDVAGALELLDRVRLGRPADDLGMIPGGRFRAAAERVWLMEAAGDVAAGAWRAYVEAGAAQVLGGLDGEIDAGRHSPEWVAAARWQRDRIVECLAGPSADVEAAHPA